MIFDPADGVCPTVEELVLCDLFRNIDLRELRGACVSIFLNKFMFFINFFLYMKKYCFIIMICFILTHLDGN